MLSAGESVHVAPMLEGESALEMLLTPLMAGCIIGVFVYMWYRKRQRAPVEKGREPREIRQLGGRIGRMNYSRPFMELRLYDDLVVLSTWGYWKCRPENLTTIEVENRLLRNRLLLRQEFDPREVHLRATDVRELADRLRRRRDARLEAADRDEPESGGASSTSSAEDGAVEPTGW